MMFGVSVVVWLSVMSMRTAGETTPANTVPQSARTRQLQDVKGTKQMMTSQHEGLKQMLTSKLQAAPSSYPRGASGSSKELWAIKSKLMTLETKLDVSETNLRATQANQKAMQIKLDAAQTKLDETKAKQDATEQELKTTRASLRTLTANRTETGSTFTHWGKTTCTMTSGLVYSGVAGGSSNNNSVAALIPVCLTIMQQFPGGHADGAEYRYILMHLHRNVPCSVCLTHHSSTIMIPATHTCPEGWITQYTGHLTANQHGYNAPIPNVCLDKDPEDANSGNHIQNGYLFNYTVTQCGGLPCPPHASGRAVPCVVCSK